MLPRRSPFSERTNLLVPFERAAPPQGNRTPSARSLTLKLHLTESHRNQRLTTNPHNLLVPHKLFVARESAPISGYGGCCPSRQSTPLCTSPSSPHAVKATPFTSPANSLSPARPIPRALAYTRPLCGPSCRTCNPPHRATCTLPTCGPLCHKNTTLGIGTSASYLRVSSELV